MNSKERVIIQQFINHYSKWASIYNEEDNVEMYEWCQGKVNAVEGLLVWLGYDNGIEGLRKEVE